MAILRYLPGATILENNIVQTVASAAGTLAAIIFVLPGLVMVGWWHGFPFFLTAGITMTGGFLGVMFSVPLRRALVVDTDLPYPEGHAAAEVLKVGAGSREGEEESARGLRVIVVNSVVSAGFAILTQTRLAVAEATQFFRIGGGGTEISGGLSFALLGVGHLVGLSVGMAMFFRDRHRLLDRAADPDRACPAGRADRGLGERELQARHPLHGCGRHRRRAVWTLVKIAGPVIGGIRSSFAASRARGRTAAVPLEERDLPFGVVAGGSLVVLVPIAALLWSTIAGGPLQGSALVLIAGHWCSCWSSGS